MHQIAGARQVFRIINAALCISLEFIKKLAFKYTSSGSPVYQYNVEPIQLATIVNEIERQSSLTGNIIEVGVARGMTTRFICEHLVSSGHSKSLKYFAIDTFSSFTKDDVDWEVTKRGKKRGEIAGFGYNDFEAWSKNFSQFDFLMPTKADASTYDYANAAPIKLAFLDVDLYLPTLKALPLIYEQLVPGGAILVDDVLSNNRWDGAYQAYTEFCEENDLHPKIIGNKCGVIRKQA